MIKPFTIIAAMIVCGAISHSAISQGTTVKKPTLGSIDTLYFASQWEKARSGYELITSKNPETTTAITWNRLGFCYQNLGNYQAALKNYDKSMAAKPAAGLKPFLTSRIARVYSMLNDKTHALSWLDSAFAAGYANTQELDTLKDYNAIRQEPRFQEIKKKATAITFPCTANPRNHDFDFWIGEWDVYKTGTTAPVSGHSLVQSASGECMILENWTALLGGGGNGKSINYYDPATKLWEQDWIGSDGNPIRFVNGAYSDGAMRFTFDSVQPDGSKWPGRFIFYNQGPNQVRQFSEHSPDGGKTWQTNYDLTYVRKKK